MGILFFCNGIYGRICHQNVKQQKTIPSIKAILKLIAASIIVAKEEMKNDAIF